LNKTIKKQLENFTNKSFLQLFNSLKQKAIEERIAMIKIDDPTEKYMEIIKDAEEYGLSTQENSRFSQFKSEFVHYQNWMKTYNRIF